MGEKSDDDFTAGCAVLIGCALDILIIAAVIASVYFLVQSIVFVSYNATGTVTQTLVQGGDDYVTISQDDGKTQVLSVNTSVYLTLKDGDTCTFQVPLWNLLSVRSAECSTPSAAPNAK